MLFLSLMNSKKLIKTIIVHMLTLAFLVVACNASVLGTKPFGFAVHLAVLIGGGSPLASLYFVAAAVLTGMSVPSLAVSAALGALGVVTDMAVRFLSAVKRKKLWRTVADIVLQSTVYGVLMWLFGGVRLIVILSVSIGAAAGALISFAAPLLASGNFVRPNAFETAGLAAFCVVFFAGLEPVHIIEYPVSRLVFALFVLMTCNCRGGKGALVGGLLAGIGGALPGADASVFVVCCLSAFAASAFAGGFRALPALALPLGLTAASCFFSYDTTEMLWNLAAAGTGSAVYICLPKKAVDGIRAFFKPSEKLLPEVAAAGMGRKLPERLLRTSEALGEMSRLLSEDSGDGNTGMIVSAVADALLGVCRTCDKRPTCEIAEDMPRLAADYVNGGGSLKNSVLAMPCVFGGRLLRVAGDSADEMKTVAANGEAEGRSSSSYARRLDSLRRLLVRLSKSVAEDYRYDPDLSEKLVRDLSELGVPCGGGLITKELCGVAIVPRDTEKSEIERAARRVVGRIRIDRTDDIAPGWTAAAFSPEGALDVVYAVAQTPRQGNTATGDSYSATSDGNRALLSLCDGSGTGRGAARLSQATLSLIESHYRAGFDAEDGISSVNSFLASRAGEEFSALDVVSVDLTTGDADIIKAGSPSTFLLRGDGMTRIDGSALPVGALETASYALAKKRLRPGDVIVLVTDGVSDALPDLPETIAAQSRLNVRRMADGILAAAVKGGVRDDMSVLAARIIERGNG